MGHGLGPIDKHRHIPVMGQRDDLPNRIDRAQRVRYVHDRHQPGARVEQPFVLLEEEFALFIDRHHA